MGSADTAGLPEQALGIIPRAVARVFTDVEERQEQISITVKASFLEIYNEEIKDLLAPAGMQRDRTNIMIREAPDGTISVNGLTEVVVSSCADTLQLLEAGAIARTTGSTLMNSVSSRSHAIFTLSLEQRFPAAEGSIHEEVRLSKFHFVDLAGSERQKRTKATGDRLKEAISINCGLLALGNVISVLGDPMKKGSHVPYRDSRLTRMLQDSLGGNSKTVFIGCVSPAVSDMDESKNSLRYANRCASRPLPSRPSAAVMLTADICAQGAQHPEQSGHQHGRGVLGDLRAAAAHRLPRGDARGARHRGARRERGRRRRLGRDDALDVGAGRRQRGQCVPESRTVAAGAPAGSWLVS